MSFSVRVCTGLSEECADFLRSMIERGEADSISQPIRKCIGVAMERLRGGGA